MNEVGEDYTVVLNTPELASLSFTRTEKLVRGSSALVTYSLTFARNHARHLGVGVGALIRNDAGSFELNVEYRLEYLIPGSIEPDALETNIRVLASKVGPSTLFPFVREIVASVTQRAGAVIVLPLVDWDKEVDADALEIPEPAGPIPEEVLSLPVVPR